MGKCIKQAMSILKLVQNERLQQYPQSIAIFHSHIISTTTRVKENNEIFFLMSNLEP
jgi:hypothetical protein